MQHQLATSAETASIAGGDRRDGDAEPVPEDLVQFLLRLAAVFAEEVGGFGSFVFDG